MKHHKKSDVADDPAKHNGEVVQSGNTIPSAHSSNSTMSDITQHQLNIHDCTITLLGTAHISAVSATQVEQTIANMKPHAVCIELDQHRYQTMTQNNRWNDLDIGKIIKRKEGMLLLATLVLSVYQKRLADKFGVKPGVEILRAIEVCKKLDIPLQLVDRKLQTTLLRAWRQSTIWNKLKTVAVLLSSLFATGKITEEEVERLKEGDILSTMMTEMASYLPSIKKTLIDERDSYIAQNIWKHAQKYQSMVVVIGAGHLPGIVAHLQSYQHTDTDNNAHTATSHIADEGNKISAAPHNATGIQIDGMSIEELETVPPKGKTSARLKYLIPIAVAAIIILGFINGGVSHAGTQLLYWVVVNGVLAAIGAMVALGHPLTILLSALAAPITSLNPTIGVGFVSAFIQGIVRKPRAKDIQALPTALSSIKGLYRNRVTKILLVFFFSSLGSAIGTFVALPLLLAQ